MRALTIEDHGKKCSCKIEYTTIGKGLIWYSKYDKDFFIIQLERSGTRPDSEIKECISIFNKEYNLNVSSVSGWTVRKGDLESLDRYKISELIIHESISPTKIIHDYSIF